MQQAVAGSLAAGGDAPAGGSWVGADVDTGDFAAQLLSSTCVCRPYSGLNVSAQAMGGLSRFGPCCRSSMMTIMTTSASAPASEAWTPQQHASRCAAGPVVARRGPHSGTTGPHAPHWPKAEGQRLAGAQPAAAALCCAAAGRCLVMSCCRCRCCLATSWRVRCPGVGGWGVGWGGQVQGGSSRSPTNILNGVGSAAGACWPI